MTKNYRARSSLDIYHIVAKGAGNHIIFEDDDDRLLFTRLLRKYAKELDGEIFAWTLMSDHVHIILRMPLPGIAKLLQKLGPTYFRNFNDKTDRTGPVLQDRYHSEAINTDEYLMQCVRYVHQNIEKAGVCAFEEYRWSSYHDYVGNRSSPPFDITDTSFALSVFESVDNLCVFHSFRDYAAKCIDVGKSSCRMNDDEALLLAKTLLGESDFHHIHEFDRSSRNEMLRKLRDNGLSISQIGRLTGIGRGVISRV